MDFTDINERGMVLLGCGRMGGALLRGWLQGGMNPAAARVVKRSPDPALDAMGVRVNQELPDNPAVLLLAVKPQMMEGAIPQVHPGPDTVIITVAAGLPLSWYEERFPGAPIIWAMPNTPSAIGRGVTSVIGNAATSPEQLELACALMSAVGDVVRLEREDQMPAAMAVAGCGPAYVFHMIEALAQAGEAQGLAPDMAMQLARATVSGAGALVDAEAETPAATLRENVTSPGGVTAAALAVLMDGETGLPPLMGRALAAAVARNAELSQ